MLRSGTDVACEDGHCIGHQRDGCKTVSLMGIGTGVQGVAVSGTGGGDAIKIGIFLDVDARRALIIDHNKPTALDSAIAIGGIPVGGKIALQGPKHGLRANFLAALVSAPAGVPKLLSTTVDMA